MNGRSKVDKDKRQIIWKWPAKRQLSRHEAGDACIHGRDGDAPSGEGLHGGGVPPIRFAIVDVEAVLAESRDGRRVALGAERDDEDVRAQARAVDRGRAARGVDRLDLAPPDVDATISQQLESPLAVAEGLHPDDAPVLSQSHDERLAPIDEDDLVSIISFTPGARGAHGHG